jgi:hypothetical protein
MKVKRIPEGQIMVLEISGKIMGGPDFDMFKSNVKERVLSIFHVSQLERVFDVHPDRETALASFA